MASSRKRVRYNFDVAFGTQEEKDAFMDRLRRVCQLLTPPQCPTVDNNHSFCAMFDAVEREVQQVNLHCKNLVVTVTTLGLFTR